MMKSSFLAVIGVMLGIFSMGAALAQPVKIQSNLPKTTTATTMATSIEDGIYFIKIANTGKYLGVAGIDPQNGAAVIQWDYADLDNHKFELKNNTNGQFTLKAMHSKRFLNVADQSVDDNAPVIQWDYVNQENLLFRLMKNPAGDGFYVRCEQSKKYWHIYGGQTNTANAAPLVQFSGPGATFIFERVPGSGSLFDVKGQTSDLNSVLSKTIKKTRTTSDGLTLTSTYYISEPVIQHSIPRNNLSGKARSSEPRPVDSGDIECETAYIRISLDDNSFMTADIASQLSEIIPGSVFNILDFLNGSWNRQTDLLQPITLSADVKNVIAGGYVNQEVESPTVPHLRQAIANLYGQFSADPSKQTNLSYNATIKEVHNEADFQLQIGANAHYLAYSLENLFNFQQNAKRTYLLLDITKLMFTIDAHGKAGSFFSDELLNQDPNMVYLKRADYGMRILASVETSESLEVIANKLNIEVNALVAGAGVDLGILSRELSRETTVKMFVVGGQSRDIVPAYSLDDLKSKVETMVRNLTYHTSQPIKYTIATTRDNYIVNYHSATDEFIRQRCVPPAVKSRGQTVSFGGLMMQADPRANGDVEMYGKVWVMAYQADGKEIPALRGQNMLMDISGENSIDLEEPGSQIVPGSTAKYILPPGTAEGAWFEIYFSLFEKDANPDYAYADGDDDHFTFLYMDNTKTCETGNYSRRLCMKKIYLSELMGASPYQGMESFGWDGDIVKMIRLDISVVPL
ncbi:MAG: RICIN domain-containing protein [Bacteroidia bacterium]